MSTSLNPMQNQDNTHRSQMTSELKSHEASKQLADDEGVRKAQKEEEDRRLREAKEMEEQDAMDPKNDKGQKHHNPKKKNDPKKDNDAASKKAQRYMGGQFFDGTA